MGSIGLRVWKGRAFPTLISMNVYTIHVVVVVVVVVIKYLLPC